MSAPGLFDQAIAAFALHAIWQVPLFACAAWMAVRVGRPTVRVAHGLWVATLMFCVAAPMVSTLQGYRTARAHANAVAVTVGYATDDAAYDLPALQQESAWSRLVHTHFNTVDGVKPFAFALPPRVARGIVVVYVLLFAIACLRFGFAWRRARSLVRGASVDVPHEFVEAMQAHCEEMGCRAPRVAISDEVAGPLLAGVMQPTLLLPANSAEEMREEEVDAVLAHELSHLRRHDPLWHAACSVLLLPVQFHPMAMWVASRIRQTREMACDADAVAWIGSSSDYADALLCVAERMAFTTGVAAGVGLGLFDVERVKAAAIRDRWPWSKSRPATAGLEFFNATGAMEERMQSMMKHDETMSLRSRWTRGMAAAAIAASGVAAACMVQVQPTVAAQQVSAAQPQVDQQVIIEDHPPALVSGHSAQKQLRNASRKLNEAEANAATNEDRNKIATAQQMLRMAQSELAEQSGSHPMLIHVPQIKGLDHLDMQLKPLDDQAVQLKLDTQDIKLMQADQQKILVIRALNRSEAPIRLQKQAVDQVRVQVDAQIQDQVQRVQRIAKDAVIIARLEPPLVLVEQQEAPKPARVSSNVMAGQVVTKTQPIYPVSAKEAKISGSVVLHAIIDENGKVAQLAVVSSPDKELSKSAIDAVQQWVYKPYLLNGRPTAVDTTITVNYSFSG